MKVLKQEFEVKLLEVSIEFTLKSLFCYRRHSQNLSLIFNCKNLLIYYILARDITMIVHDHDKIVNISV